MFDAFWHPKSIPKIIKNPFKNQSKNQSIFYYILEPKVFQNQPQNPLKINDIFNDFLVDFLGHFGSLWASILEGFGHHFWYLFRHSENVKKLTAPTREHQNWGSGGSRGDQKIMPKMNSKIFQKTIGFGTVFITIWASFWYPENLKKSTKNSTHFRRGFGIDFSLILAPKVYPKMHPKLHHFLIDFWMHFGSLFGSHFGSKIAQKGARLKATTGLWQRLRAKRAQGYPQSQK